MEVSALGAVVGLVLAIYMIIKKVHPVYGLMTGALVGGLVGGASLVDTVSLMIGGAQGIMPAILRIISAGVLAGVLIESGAAEKIAESIVDALGDSNSIIALAAATLILTSVGVFIDVSVITVAPIALAIAAADAFEVPLTSIMSAGIIPAIVGFVVTIIIAKKVAQKGAKVEASEITVDNSEKPSLFASLVGPLVAIILLALRPLFDIQIDPLIALPVGGIIGAICMGRIKKLNQYALAGLTRMTGVAILLIGTGTIAGIIANSQLKDVIINGLTTLGLPAFLLAPVAGILMSAATASTTSGTAVGSQVFGPTLLGLGIQGKAAGAMIHSGATVLDHLPHGSFFHATGGSVYMSMQDRLKVMPYETLIGLSMTLTSTIIFGLLKLL